MVVIAFITIIYSVIDIEDKKNSERVKIELVSCIDGDTAKFVIDVKEEKVRFLGIDTPESTNYVETYGKEASEYTCNLLILALPGRKSRKRPEGGARIP